MIIYKILKDKFVNNNHYQLVERKDCVASDYSIVVPIFEKIQWHGNFLLNGNWKVYKKLFDDLEEQGD